MNATRQQSLLDAHNEARARYGVAPLRWDDLLAADAQRYAEEIAQTCTLRHAQQRGQGENLAYAAGRPVNAQGWLDEETYFECGVPYRFEPRVGHFTQMLWADTTHVGCGIARCAGRNNAEMLVCRYSPPGNRIGGYVVPRAYCAQAVPPGATPPSRRPAQPASQPEPRPQPPPQPQPAPPPVVRRPAPQPQPRPAPPPVVRRPAPSPQPQPRPAPQATTVQYRRPQNVPADALYVDDPSTPDVRTYFWPALTQDDVARLSADDRRILTQRVRMAPEWNSAQVQGERVPLRPQPAMPQPVRNPFATGVPDMGDSDLFFRFLQSYPY